MAKQRIVNTKFWDDSYIAGLTPTEKYLFLYLLTSPLTDICGVYELPIRRAAFDVGIGVEEVESIVSRFESDGKICRLGVWVGIKNFIKYQTLNPRVKAGIVNGLNRAPLELVDRLCIDFKGLSIDYDRLSHSNSNPNPNANSNLNLNDSSSKELSTAEAQDIHRRATELSERWRVKR